MTLTLTQVRHDPTPKDGRTAYHLFQSTSSGGHRSVLRCEVLRSASDGAADSASGSPTRDEICDVELEVQSTAAGEWEFVDGISERPVRELSRRVFRAAVPPHVVILSVPHVRAPPGDAPAAA